MTWQLHLACTHGCGIGTAVYKKMSQALYDTQGIVRARTMDGKADAGSDILESTIGSAPLSIRTKRALSVCTAVLSGKYSELVCSGMKHSLQWTSVRPGDVLESWLMSSPSFFLHAPCRCSQTSLYCIQAGLGTGLGAFFA